jgi:hypothetical protein
MENVITVILLAPTIMLFDKDIKQKNRRFLKISVDIAA